jgi:DNA polymerase-3 subunit beta
MKIQTTRDELLNKILFVNRAMAPKITNFILSGIMLEASKNLLNIYSTDLETSIKTSTAVSIIEEGRVIVPSKILINVLKSFLESKVELEFLPTTNELKVTCQNAQFRLNTYSLEEYPQFPQIKKQNSFNINIKNLKQLISKVQKSSSTDESRIILTGILIDISKGSLKLVSTDSYRLSLVEDSAGYENGPVKVVVPARVLDTLLRSDLVDGEVEVNIEENQISFVLVEDKNTRTVIISRLLSGKFPDYDKLIPTAFNHNIIMNKDLILEVVKRISSISQDNIPIRLDIEKGKVTVSMNIREVGSSSEDFEVVYGEEKIQMAFNPDFLIDGLNIIDSEKIMFSIVEPLRPVLIRPEKVENLLYLLMPIRIS